MLNALSVAEQRLALVVMALLVGGLGLAEWRRSLPVEESVAAGVPGVVLSPAELVPSESVASPLASARAGRIDLNEADARLLEALPGVGPAKAAAIIDDRTINGPFASVDDLDRVAGFGEKTVARLAPYLSIGSQAAEASAPDVAAPPTATTAPANPGFLILTHRMAIAQAGNIQRTAGASPVERAAAPRPAPAAVAAASLNINTATAEQFEALDGVGPVLARRIVEYRTAHGPFRSIDELDRVKGIGPSIMARNRHRLAVH